LHTALLRCPAEVPGRGALGKASLRPMGRARPCSARGSARTRTTPV